MMMMCMYDFMCGCECVYSQFIYCRPFSLGDFACFCFFIFMSFNPSFIQAICSILNSFRFRTEFGPAFHNFIIFGLSLTIIHIHYIPVPLYVLSIHNQFFVYCIELANSFCIRLPIADVTKATGDAPPLQGRLSDPLVFPAGFRVCCSNGSKLRRMYLRHGRSWGPQVLSSTGDGMRAWVFLVVLQFYILFFLSYTLSIIYFAYLVTITLLGGLIYQPT